MWSARLAARQRLTEFQARLRTALLKPGTRSNLRVEPGGRLRRMTEIPVISLPAFGKMLRLVRERGDNATQRWCFVWRAGSEAGLEPAKLQERALHPGAEHLRTNRCRAPARTFSGISVTFS